MNPSTWNRRQILNRCGMGIGALGLAPLLNTSAAASSPLAPKTPPQRAAAKQAIHIFLNGGPSHVDTFDPKPLLQRYQGRPLPVDNLPTERATGNAFPSPYRFSQYGESGLPFSEIFARTAECADDICVVRSMYADVPNHEPSFLLWNCGDARLPRPSMGSWVTYGLGSENQNLPGFVALCPHGLPTQGTENWRSAFLPGIYQGAHIDTQFTNIEKLIENIRNTTLTTTHQRRQLDLLLAANQEHLAARGHDPNLEARIESFELAYRMQSEAADAFDIEQEPQYIRDMYGSTVQARTLLLARRLVERGVRFVQVWYSGGQPWDNHDNIQIHGQLASQIDQPISALLKDLKQRGLLDETLVLCGGEFGRTPTVELPRPLLNSGKQLGRDHNHHGFSVWLAGGGIRGGHVHGATDETGWKAVEDRVHVHDIHATMLHLLGFDHETFTYRYAGRDFRLTDVHGKVIQGICRSP
ncbi:MAG: sulfatase [Planctomycetaceae bacterium]|nr:sulfatase [Planctomycetaceae bacterium]